MSTTLSQLTESQAQKATKTNENFAAVSPAGIFALRSHSAASLDWGYYGGDIYVDGTLTPIADGTETLSASSTNYVEVARDGVVSSNTSGFTAGATPLYEVTTNGTGVTGYTDCRVLNYRNDSRAVQAMADANQTLSAIKARCDVIETTGALTAGRNLVVPDAARQYTINNQCTGFSVTVKTAGGTGIAIAVGKTAIVRSDGTNVVRVTADV